MLASLNDTHQVLAEIDAANASMAAAFHKVLQIAEACLAQDHLPPAVATTLNEIVFECTAEDMVGQRLGRARRLLLGGQDDPLLRGPPLAGEGLSQDAADALFDEALIGEP